MSQLDKEYFRAQLLRYRKEIGKSYTTIKVWVDNGSCPAHVCLLVEELTNGEITAGMIRPDLFKPTPAQKEMARAFLDSFSETIDAGLARVAIYQLNYFESQCPKLYGFIIGELIQTAKGKELIEQRLAHRNHLS